jgi:hypothetical protein
MKLRLRIKPAIDGSQTGAKSALPGDWRESLPDRPSRPRHRRNGRLVPVKSEPLSRKVRITTGQDSRAVRGELDLRYSFAKEIARYTAEYQEHLGDSRSVVQDDLCRSAARHKAIMNLSLYRFMSAGPLDDKDQARAAYEAFRRADADHRSVLGLLGIPRREKDVPDLHTYLAQKSRNGKRLPLRIKAPEEIE